MYRYDDFDAAFVRQRVDEFRAQVKRRVDGVITEDEFKPFVCKTGSTCNCMRICCGWRSLTAP